MAQQRPDESTKHPSRQPTRPHEATQDEHEGALEEQVNDRSGPGPGFDEEPEQDQDTTGVRPS